MASAKTSSGMCSQSRMRKSTVRTNKVAKDREDEDDSNEKKEHGTRAQTDCNRIRAVVNGKVHRVEAGSKQTKQADCDPFTTRTPSYGTRTEVKESKRQMVDHSVTEKMEEEDLEVMQSRT